MKFESMMQRVEYLERRLIDARQAEDPGLRDAALFDVLTELVAEEREEADRCAF